MVAYPSIFNATSFKLSAVDVPVYIFKNGVQVHPEKLHTKAGDNI